MPTVEIYFYDSSKIYHIFYRNYVGNNKHIVFCRIQDFFKYDTIKEELNMLNQKQVIGNTPMIKINYQYKGVTHKIFVKLEYFNLTGSIKDRVAFI